MKKQLNLSTALATVAFSAMAFATPVALAQDAAQPETTQEQMEAASDAAPADDAATMEKAPEAEAGTDTMTEPAMESEEAMPATDMDTAPTTDMAATSTEKFFVYEAANQMTSDDLIGSDIKNTAGESLGDVEQIIVSTEGDLAGIIVGVGGFLGIGEKSVAINFDAITFETDPDSGDTLLVLNSTKEELEAAPEFTTKEQQASEEEAMTTAEPMAETPVAPETMEAPKEEVPAQ
ncbi:PRC-barrel domain-containing protein [Ahrensia kielensis]|uniref:PRC-barrel domain-containing protein n=1 Tax=Ahrensia kielensis TaxID=76980 RepID=A0ABU9T4M0_9HYPH